MLIATQGKSVTATQQYFDTVLTQGDYYLGQEINGTWQGLGTDELDLKRGADVTKKQFNALLRGEHPETGASLTQRSRTDRRPGMDLTFSVPKSVSLAWAINNDERIIDVLRATVHETMTKDIEPLMQRRVRNGVNASTRRRTGTGKMIYADFLHKTSRPVDGAPDPHLHVHAFVINWTHQNGKHFAAEMGEVVRQRPSLQAKFDARLAKRLEEDLGYTVTKTSYQQSGRIKAGWEISGISRRTIEDFSRRTEQVEKVAREEGINDEATKATLGAKTREKKLQGKAIDTLRKEWQTRLSEDERRSFDRLQSPRSRTKEQSLEAAPRQAIDFAIDHHLFSQSTVERHTIVGTALEHGLTLTPEQIETALDERDVIQRSREVDGANRDYITTREVLAAEREIISYSRDGRGTKKAMGKGQHAFEKDWLNTQQKAAVQHVLDSRDSVIAVTGGAGTGKSSLMQEASVALRGSGKEVFAFAPSTGARDVLQEKGFGNAQTVEHLLRNTELQSQIWDEVIWVDEAGLLDVRSMRGIFKIAREQNARVVLSGDTRQHASPRRGEALRMLENEAGLKAARVEIIQRQRGEYRDAIETISQGHDMADEHSGKSGLVSGFDQLDRMGKIQEIDHEKRHGLLADQYVETIKQKKSALVVAPTHSEARQITGEIRDRLKDIGKLSGNEKKITQLRSMNLTEAEKSQPRTYEHADDLLVQFHQNVSGGFKRGDRYRIVTCRDGKVELSSETSDETKHLPLGTPDRFEVYRETAIELAEGDRVRFTLGGSGKDGKRRISNGRMDEIKGFKQNGDLILKSGFTVDRDYGHLDLGYVVTSHASQGKDCQVAIAAMGSESLPAINAKQFYVTASRGSEDLTIYVDDKSRVRRAIARSGEQLSATELVKPQQEQEAAETRYREHDYFRRSHEAFCGFRDRVVQWWREQRESSQSHDACGAPQEADFGRAFGMAMSPELGRSR